jgi:hypothetical protein
VLVAALVLVQRWAAAIGWWKRRRRGIAGEWRLRGDESDRECDVMCL